MIPYVFVAAATLAMFPILTLYKMNVEKLKQDPSQHARVQNNLMIGVALSEAIPILLIIYGYAQMESVSTVSDLYLPGIILLFLVIFAVLFIFMQAKVGVPEEAKSMITQYSIISLMLALAIPIISIVSLFMMMP